MKLTDVIHSEAERQEPEKWGRIILHKEGKFIHAYEWSAWLIKQIVCTEEFQKQRGDQKMLSANRYKMKDGEYVMIGFPIERLRHHILSESRNYQRKCYVMSLDVRGYFMHIKRVFLLDIATKTIEKMRSHRVCVDTKQTWGEYLDIDFVLWLTKEIIMLDPTKKCRVVGKKEDWDGLDRNKSLFWTNDGCGLPIGNLTSQLFSNVYLNVYDQFVKRVLKFKHFGRYVDDSYIVCHDKKKLLESAPKIREFLNEALEVNLHMGKLQIREVGIGAGFLGAFIKPFRSYISNATLYRTKVSMSKLDFDDVESTYRSINSFLGTLGHYSSYNIRCNLFLNEKMLKVAPFEKGLLKMDKPFLLTI